MFNIKYFFTQVKINIFWKIYRVAITLFLIGIILLNINIKRDILFLGISLTNLLQQLGLAFVISAILNVTIEFIIRKEFLTEALKWKDEISRNVVDAIFKKRIPEEIYQEIEDTIFNVPFIYKNFEVFIDLGQDKHSELIFGKVLFSFWIVNLTKNTKEYTFKPSFVTSVSLDEEKLKKVGFDVFKIKDENGKVEFECKNFEDKFSFEKKYNIPTEPRKILIQYSNYYYLNDTFVWVTQLSSINLSVTITFPDNLKVYGKPLQINGRGKFETIEMEGRNSPLTYKINGGVYLVRVW